MAKLRKSNEVTGVLTNVYLNGLKISVTNKGGKVVEKTLAMAPSIRDALKEVAGIGDKVTLSYNQLGYLTDSKLIEKGVYIQPAVPPTPDEKPSSVEASADVAVDETAAELPAEKSTYTELAEPTLVQPDTKEKLYMHSQKPVPSSKLLTPMAPQSTTYTLFHDMNRQRVIVLQVCLKLAVDTVNTYPEPIVGDRVTVVTGVADQYYNYIKKKLEEIA